jgi:hypothetical protein
MSQAAAIRVGLGGWNFEPWRNNFYPSGLTPVDFDSLLRLLPTQADELALRHVLDVRDESFRSPAFLAMVLAEPAG